MFYKVPDKDPTSKDDRVWLPLEVIETAKNHIRTSSASVLGNIFRSDPFDYAIGFRQSSLVSDILFNLYINSLF